MEYIPQIDAEDDGLWKEIRADLGKVRARRRRQSSRKLSGNTPEKEHVERTPEREIDEMTELIENVKIKETKVSAKAKKKRILDFSEDAAVKSQLSPRGWSERERQTSGKGTPSIKDIMAEQLDKDGPQKMTNSKIIFTPVRRKRAKAQVN